MKKELTRLTLDIPKSEHKKLRILSASTGMSMKEIMLEGLKYIDIDCLMSSHVPNKTTRKALNDTDKGIDLISGKEAEKISKKFGI